MQMVDAFVWILATCGFIAGLQAMLASQRWLRVSRLLAVFAIGSVGIAATTLTILANRGGPSVSVAAILVMFSPFALPGILALLLLIRARRTQPGHCTTCGYNLTGNVSGKCSECGAAVVAP